MTRPTHRIAVRLGRGLTLPLLRTGFDFRVEGAHRVPSTGPALLACNHLSFLDPVVLQVALTRPIHYLMTARLHRDPRWGWLFRLFDTVPVTRGSGNFLALSAAQARLQAGEVVAVFPEGGISRDGTLGVFRPGVALLALRTAVPVLPVAIRGTREALPPGAYRPRRAQVRVRVGEPLPVSEDLDPGLLTERIREAVGALGRD